MVRLILDKIDLNILATLARDGRASYSSIGSLIGLTSRSVKARVKNMVCSGIIEKFIVRVNPAGFGYRTAHTLLRTNNGITKDDIIQRVKQFGDLAYHVHHMGRTSMAAPTIVLEVFESIKVVLGMEGFIYIVGLSHDTITKLISLKYKDSEIKGEHYLRKIIQLPITIPEWNDLDVVTNLIGTLSKKLDAKYSNIVSQNKDLIATAVELNPREVKRFINSFIVSHEIYSYRNIEKKELLVIQALRVRWNKLYTSISYSKEFRDELQKYCKLSKDDRNEKMGERKKQVNIKRLNEYESKYLFMRPMMNCGIF
jgi:DNA-binding Lrp family transcriptional regulator